MQEFKSFYFEKFSFDRESLKAKFEYSFDENYFFTEEIDFFSENFFLRKDLDEEIINNFLFSIHIALWISYYKVFPTEKLYVKSWLLDDNQIKFWQKFYKNWLGEFLYKNQINPENLFNFKKLSSVKYKKIDFSLSEKSLIPLWWWKDSLVSIDLFEKNKLDYDLVVFWKIDNIKQNCADVIDKKILLIKRKISTSLLELNANWNYNWHVPITWIIAFTLLLTCYLYDYKYIVLSNEKSASVWNTFWNGFEINHQYSKSLEFETDFKNYLNAYLSDNIEYFSLLRWWYEIKIWKYFSKNCKRFYGVFSSCNNNFKIDETKRLKQTIWCNACPKCAFVFAILRPYLTYEETLGIFWEDLFFKNDLKQTFLELLWISSFKPFECVWETEEVVLAFYKSLKLYDNKSEILLEFEKNIWWKYDEKYFKQLEEKFVTIYDEDIIPKKIKDIIFKNI